MWYNVSAAGMKAALEALPVIGAVSVQRSGGSSLHEYTWTIEFVAVNAFTPRGYELQPTSNVPPLIVHSYLVPVGHVNITVRPSNMSWQMASPFGPERYGSFGENAGAVYVFSKPAASARWVEVARLIGNDTATDSMFGSSVSLQGNQLLVGALGANMNGLPEVQSIYCAATAGYFRIHFRGWSTGLLSSNITREQLYEAIVSPDTSNFVNLYSITALTVADWGGGPLCHNKTAVLTFYSPWYGDKLMFGTDTGDHLELLKVENVGLTYGRNGTATITVAEVRAGTAHLDGINADFQQVGAAYYLEALGTCNPRALNYSDCLSGTTWVQRAQFFPISPRGGERYGEAVALGSGMAVVGAPGTRNESGLIYVYVRQTVNNVTSWAIVQRTAGLDTTSGDNFGSSLAIYRLTLAVGAPNAHHSAGAVYIFNSTRIGQPFALQYVLLPSRSYGLQPGDLYGTSVAIDNNVLVVGCPGKADTTIYLGSTPSSTPQLGSGMVFVFQRADHLSNFAFLQRLVGSNVRSRDGFGWSVAVVGRTIAVGAVENFAGTPDHTSRSSPSPGPSRAVILVTTSATYNKRPVGTSFRLVWDQTYTRPIAAQASAGELAYILQTDLNTGPVLVTRSNMDQYSGGFIWTVTFMSMDVFNNGYDFVPQISGDSSFLTGTNASVTVSVLHPSPPPLRGKTHIFQREGSGYGSLFHEEMFTSPYTYQPVDQCGYAVALRDEYYAMMGCPNRDDAIPSRNTGAAMYYDMSILKLQFASYNYNVTEGRTLALQLQREAAIANSPNFGSEVLYYVQTLDRNAPQSQQLFVQHKFDILDSNVLETQTIMDATGLVGKADGRANYYGSSHNESQWILGSYDYRGLSDYVPFNTPDSFLATTKSRSYPLITTSDGILEKPDERVSVVLSSPGLWPSILGRFYTSVTILNSNENDTQAMSRYSKIYDGMPTVNEQLGHAVAVIDVLQMVFASSPVANAGSCVSCGHVIASRLINGAGNQNSADWVQQSVITSPNPKSSAMFGDAIAAGFRVFSSAMNVTLLAVGEPGTNTVHVYSAHGSQINAYATPHLTWETSLSVPQAYLPQHRFGSQGTLALSGCTTLVVGAPGVEAIFVFNRIYHNSTAKSTRWSWTTGQMLRSMDFDYDVLYGHVSLHDMEFGRSVAASGRTLAVGAPFSDYQKLGTQYVEVNWNTEGTDIVGFGRGKVYVFYSTPPVQLVALDATQQLTDGYFRLNYTEFGATTTSRRIRYNATGDDVAAALGRMNNVLGVAASASSFSTTNGYRYTWSVTFLDMWQEPPMLVPLWHGYGCPTCSPFDASSAVPSHQMTVSRTTYIGAFAQVQDLVPSDSRDGNRFGWSVALDGDQLAVGAVYSASATTTTWDFEAGYLKGWTTTGTAFNYQPTFGDNSRFRIVRNKPQLPSVQQGAEGQTSRLLGRYYVGTYELRPGNNSDYSIPDSNFPAGGSQGDAPQGTMTSEVFLILGNSISFLVGGGCNYYKEYVELLVDGMSVEKVTGKCEERMRRVTLYVSSYQSRAGQIRVVDLSSDNWGHISVDDFRFDWDVRGANINDTSITATLHTAAPPDPITGRASANAPAAYSHPYSGNDVPGGKVETPQSGAAYAFRRHLTGSYDLCAADKTLCTWSQEAKLLASDKRASAYFGSSVAVSDSAGIIVVGSPSATLTGYLKETVVLMHSTSRLNVLPTEVSFPLRSGNATLFQGMPMYTLEAAGAPGVWYAQQQANLSVRVDPELSVEAGAVYVYVKNRAVLSSTGTVAIPQHWNATEKARIQPPDAMARDHFGAALAMDGAALVTGAEGQDGSGLANAGAVYTFNVMFAAVSFSKDLYYVVEGTDAVATVTVRRDLNIYGGELVLHYATSDLTAQGIDTYKFASCFALSTGARGGALCGDYAQTRGLMTIAAGANSGSFQIPIVNDLCKEPFMKYIQVSLSLPGSAALQGGTTLLAMVS
jgi:hypothetical protein